MLLKLPASTIAGIRIWLQLDQMLCADHLPAEVLAVMLDKLLGSGAVDFWSLKQLIQVR